MEKFIGTNFADIKQSKNNTVVPLFAMSNNVKVNNETVIVNPLIIFQRTLINKNTDEDVEDLLKYELSQYPTTLFDDGCIRKTKKSALHDKFPTCSTPLDIKASNSVVDGDLLLHHRIKWNAGTNFTSICDQYVTYIW